MLHGDVLLNLIPPPSEAHVASQSAAASLLISHTGPGMHVTLRSGGPRSPHKPARFSDSLLFHVAPGEMPIAPLGIRSIGPASVEGWAYLSLSPQCQLFLEREMTGNRADC